MPGTKILNRDLDLKGTSRLLKDGQEIIDAAGNITAPLEFSSTDFVKDTNGNEVLGFGETASAVNYVKVTNAATSGVPLISAAGDDTNVGVWVSGKGTGAVALGQATSTGVVLFADQPLLDSSLNELIKFTKTASAVNEITVTNAAAGSSPSITATGGGTNINLELDGKGSGGVLVGGVFYREQGAPTAKTTSSTLTASELAAGIVTINQGAAGASAQQLPTAADMDTAFAALPNGGSFDVSFINTSTVDAEDASVTTNTGWTLVGSMDFHAYSAAGSLNSSGILRLRKTGTAAWTAYRIC